AALGTPIVSGNVSLYNETDGAAILPTPTIGMVGLLDDLSKIIPKAPRAGDALILIGETRGRLGQSAWAAELHGLEAGDAPPVDLDAERRAGAAVLGLKAAGVLTAAQDLSDGGLAVAAAEMALAADVGVKLVSDIDMHEAAWFFGEDQGRYLLSVPRASLDDALSAIATAGVPARHVGKVEGDLIVLADMTVPLATLREAHEAAIPALMGELDPVAPAA
ncbi:MAG: AIR synthase-related protein, partial [Pseudomonadota bacterium]